MKRFGPLALCAALAALVVPAYAGASTTTVDVVSSGQTLLVTARGSERNLISVSVDNAAAPTALLVADSGAGIDPTDATCTEPVSGLVSCPIGVVNRIDASLGNQGDFMTTAATVPARIRSTIDGGSEADLISGGSGNDDLNGGAGNDLLSGAAGIDNLDGGSGNDFFTADPGADFIHGGTGSDTMSYATRTAGVQASIGGFFGQDGSFEDGLPGIGDTIDADIENVYGGFGSDLLIGDGDSNLLAGGAGNDYISGLARGDQVIGGSGADLLTGGLGDDAVNGGTGADKLFGGAGNDLLKARDGHRDPRLNCGSGRRDRLKRDRHDPRGKSCKAKHRR